MINLFCVCDGRLTDSLEGNKNENIFCLEIFTQDPSCGMILSLIFWVVHLGSAMATVGIGGECFHSNIFHKFHAKILHISSNISFLLGPSANGYFIIIVCLLVS